MTYYANVLGAFPVDDDAPDLDEPMVLVVRTTVKKQGKVSTEAHGHVESRGFKMTSMAILDGKEAAKWEQILGQVERDRDEGIIEAKLAKAEAAAAAEEEVTP